MNAPTELFSALQIARALGCSKQNVRKHLLGIAPAGETFANGNLTRAWSIDSLPSPLLRQLATKAEAKKCRSVSHLLSADVARYELAIPLARLAPDVLDRARKLQRSLRRILPRRNDTTANAMEFKAAGLAAYKREFGHVITEKHWRALLTRTIDRDNGLDEWERLELYVDERANSENVTRTPIEATPIAGLEILSDALHEMAGATAQTALQLVYLWTKACDQLQAQMEAGIPARRAKRAVVRALVKSGVCGTNAESIRRNLDRKWAAYSEGDGRLQDKRTLRYAKAALALTEDDRRRLIAKTLDCGGRFSQAFREACQNGELSRELTERYIANPARKSYAPQSLRNTIVPEARRLMALHHGPREHQLRGAFNSRDWSGMFAGDSYSADDCTCPVVYYEADSTSQSGFRIIRGQLLLMIDERSLLALGFALHSENNYNSRIIRALITRVHDAYGLPRRRFYFEGGVWKNSKILTGEKNPFGHALELSQTEIGLREFGIKFCHAKLPRGKTIERILGLLQNRMEKLPGYVGRDEIHDRFERVQEQINAARAGHAHPAKFFLSKDQWSTQLAVFLSEYNAERQEGRVLSGHSPLEAWNKFQSPEGQVHLGERARHLLAHHKLKLRVRRGGITLRPSLGGGTYCNESTGRFVGQDVLVWCNPEDLEYVALTSLDRKTGPFVIPRLAPLPAIDATPEQLAASAQQIDGHNGYAKTVYRLISPHLAVHNFRKLHFVDSGTVAFGERLSDEVEATKSSQRRVRANVRKVGTLSRELNLQPKYQVTPQLAERTAAGLDLIAESRKQRAEQLRQTT